MNLFITSASPSTGLGHLSRTIAIASHFRKKDNYLFINNFNCLNFVDKKNFSKIFIHNRTNLYDKLKKFSKIYLTKKLKIFIDDYRLSSSLIKKINSLHSIVIEHIPKKKANKLLSDISICLSPIKSNQTKRVLLSGAKYFVLNRKRFNFKNLKKKEKKIIISLGGGSDKNCVKKIIQALILKRNPIQNIEIYTTKLNQFNKKNKIYIKKINFETEYKIRYFIDDKNFIKNLRTCNLIITTPGLTFFEASYLKIPILLVSLNKIQEQHLKSFSNYKKIYLGDYRNINFSRLDNFSKNIYSKKIMKKKVFKFIDKFGFKRINNEIKKIDV
jgi:spore coat polysaccharide biosynthesis predicted glycosyltransferase SpsG